MEQERKKQEADAATRHTHTKEVRKQVREKEADKLMWRRAKERYVRKLMLIVLFSEN